jgi:hypothetical protein
MVKHTLLLPRAEDKVLPQSFLKPKNILIMVIRALTGIRLKRYTRQRRHFKSPGRPSRTTTLSSKLSTEIPRPTKGLLDSIVIAARSTLLRSLMRWETDTRIQPLMQVCQVPAMANCLKCKLPESGLLLKFASLSEGNTNGRL